MPSKVSRVGKGFVLHEALSPYESSEDRTGSYRSCVKRVADVGVPTHLSFCSKKLLT